MRADWTASGERTSGSTAPPMGATRPDIGGTATTSTTEAERFRGEIAGRIASERWRRHRAYHQHGPEKFNACLVVGPSPGNYRIYRRYADHCDHAGWFHNVRRIPLSDRQNDIRFRALQRLKAFPSDWPSC